jgi:hypothetical protein
LGRKRLRQQRSPPSEPLPLAYQRWLGQCFHSSLQGCRWVIDDIVLILRSIYRAASQTVALLRSSRSLAMTRRRDGLSRICRPSNEPMHTLAVHMPAFTTQQYGDAR